MKDLVKWDLSGLDIAQSREFLVYFNSALRDKESGFVLGNGQAGFEGSTYVSELSVDTEMQSGDKRMVTWIVVTDLNGKLISISAQCPDYTQVVEQELREFFDAIFVSVIGRRKETFFKRDYFSTISGCNLPGEYWLPTFRLAPLHTDDESHLINAERTVVIDQNIEAVDKSHANEIATEKALLYSAYLSFILDIGLEKPKHEHRWVLHDRDGLHFAERLSTQLWDTNPPREMPQKGEICRLAEWKGSILDTLKPHNRELRCPKETRIILRGIESSDERVKTAILRCCTLYQLGQVVGRYNPTVRISYECAAVEAITKVLNKEFIGFNDFMGRYYGDNDELYNLIYQKIRSAHWHAGELRFGEHDSGWDFIGGLQRHITHNTLLSSHLALRSAAVNWLLEVLEISEQ
jgi:hypothetical protein